MLGLGTTAPDFSLKNVTTSDTVSRNDYQDQPLLIMFICRHCPYVQHVVVELAQIGKDYQDTKLGIVAISSNDPASHPQDAPASLKEMHQEQGFTFPLLFDADQSVAKNYTATCTPDFFLFDQDHQLVYRGQLDDSRPGNNQPVSGKDLRAAIDAVLKGQPVNPDQKPSSGCNIKWQPGNAPDYA